MKSGREELGQGWGDGVFISTLVRHHVFLAGKCLGQSERASWKAHKSAFCILGRRHRELRTWWTMRWLYEAMTEADVGEHGISFMAVTGRRLACLQDLAWP
jgi:hypothetical protein